MLKLLKRLWEKFKFKFIGVDGIDNPIQQTTRTPASVKECTTQVCTRDKATRARVSKAIKQQQKQMQMRALKAHDASCKDPLTCTKRHCFVREADKEVGRSTVTRPMTKARLRSGLGCRKKSS